MPDLVRFGPFELDLGTAELRTNGNKLRLPEQQFQILQMLLTERGGVVSREEIRKRLWPDDTVVEFDRSINAAIMKLRMALGDTGDKPRCIETLVKRGYRLMVPIEQESPESPALSNGGSAKGMNRDLPAEQVPRSSLDDVLSGAPEVFDGAGAAPRKKTFAALLLLSLGTMLIGAVAGWILKPAVSVPPRQVQRFEIPASEVSSSVIALSPDGTSLAIMGLQRDGMASGMWLHRMDSLETRPIEGTEGAFAVPFWSPDSRFIVFATRDGKLKKVDTEGGPAVVLCDSGVPVVGGSWTSDGKIIFGAPTRGLGLWEVPATGGVSSPLPGLEHATRSYQNPVLLPDGRHFLYKTGGPTTGDVFLGSLDGRPVQENTRLLTGVSGPGAFYSPSTNPNLGYLLFVHGSAPESPTGTLMAQPFDPKKRELRGEPVAIAEGLTGADFSASVTGTLIYASGGSGGTGLVQLTLFERQGKMQGTMTDEPGGYEQVALSPDGKRVATARTNFEAASENLWMLDPVRGISTRFTFSSRWDSSPVWSPDGNRIAFSSNRGSDNGLYQKLANGGGAAELLLKSDEALVPLSWSGDGRFLLLGEAGVESASILVLPLDENAHPAGKPFPFAQNRVGIEAEFSPGPQGHPLWVAYASNESGRYEIYVRPFDPHSPNGTPTGGAKWQVSTGGGISPRWNGNGRELFYVAPDGTVMSADVRGISTAFQSGIPKPLFRPKGLWPHASGYIYWDASADGKKFIFELSPTANAANPLTQTRFTVVLNWTSLLKK